MIEFPYQVLTPIDVSLALAYNTRPGPQATNGMQRSRGYSGAQFRLRFNFYIRDTQTARAARAFFWNIEGDSNLVRIQMPNRYGIDGPFALATAAAKKAYPDGIPFAGDVFYSDGVGHGIPTLEATFQTSAGATDREIYVTAEEELPAGCAISIDEFAYGIAGSWMEGGVNRLKLSPPLRKAAATGDTIALAPVFVGVCITENPGYEALRLGRFGEHELEFVEDLTRLVESVD